MPVASIHEDSVIFGQRLAILQPDNLGPGGGMNRTNDFRLVVLGCVNKILLLLNHGGI